jgi:hypothetical protein
MAVRDVGFYGKRSLPDARRMLTTDIARADRDVANIGPSGPPAATHLQGLAKMGQALLGYRVAGLSGEREDAALASLDARERARDATMANALQAGVPIAAVPAQAEVLAQGATVEQPGYEAQDAVQARAAVPGVAGHTGGYGAMLNVLAGEPDLDDFRKEITLKQFAQKQAAAAADLAWTRKMEGFRTKAEIEAEFETPTTTTAQKNALALGLVPGTPKYNEYIAASTGKRGTNVTVNTGRPKAPAGYQYNQDGTLSEIKGGPVEAKRLESEKKAAATQLNLDKAIQKTLEASGTTQKVMERAVKGALAMLDAADKDRLSLGASGTFSQIPGLFSGTYAGKIRSHIETLKSPIVMQGIEKLRASSSSGATGFGAMNEAELKILTERLGALNPATTDPAILRKTLDGVLEQIEIVKKDILANVPHDRLREIGLGFWIPEEKKVITVEQAAKALAERATQKSQAQEGQ